MIPSIIPDDILYADRTFLEIEYHNEGGVMDTRSVVGEDEEAAGKAAKATLLEMLAEVPYLAEGDKIIIRKR
jgi:hypothetical protein